VITVLVADDHPLVRKGLHQILREAGDIAVGAEAASAQEVLGLVRSRPFDAVILDINLPGRSGLDLLADLRRERPRLPALVLTVHAEELFAVRAFKEGARGYLTKDAAAERLVEAVRRVASGGRYVSPELAERLAGSLAEGEGPRHAALSAREFEVLRLLAAGRTVSQVAAAIHLSVKTVSTYRARLLEKLGLATTAELVRYAVHHGLD
jgi:DNA-binding NarL/FixJ family response regulator